MDLAIFGAGGFALQMLDTVEALQKAGRQVCFVSDEGLGDLCGHPVLKPQDVPKGTPYCIAVAGTVARAQIAKRIECFGSLYASSARVSAHAEIGEGGMIAHHAVIEAKARIGRHFHANLQSYVAHECVIGEFVTFAPGVSCNGNVHIGDYAYIGTRAMIRQGTPDKPLIIGAGAVIGMGAVVTKDVPPGVTVLGNPARLMRQRGQ